MMYFMDKLTDGVSTDQKLLQNRKDAIWAIISMIVFLVIMASFYFFG